MSKREADYQLPGRETLLGLDIGTTKVAAVIASRRPDIAVLGAASVPCAGLKKGAVVDVAETTRAIREAAGKAQRMAGVELEPAWLGITGQHVACHNAHGELSIARVNREITWGDVERVMGAAVRAASIPSDRQVIHAISRGFVVDDQTSVRNPTGLSANRLAVETHIVTASRNLVTNVARCAEQAGLEVAELVAEPLATADAVLTQEDEDLGVLLIDVGGGTTDLALFLNGAILFTGAIPAAGKNVTHDLAVALGVTHSQAEQIKLTHGCARSDLVSEEEMVPLPEEDEQRTVSRRLIAEVIEARVRETFSLVARELSRLGPRWPPPGGAVLTGGGSLLPHIASVANDTLGCRVRLGLPRTASGPVELLQSPALSTAVGLVYYAHRESQVRRADVKPAERVRPLLGRVASWVRELFGS